MPSRIAHIQWLLAGLMVVGVGCQRDEGESIATADVAPAAVNVVRLSPQSQARIGIQTAAAERQPVARTLAATGWLTTRPGDEVQIKAAATGFVVPASESAVELGGTVADGQVLARLRVFLSPQEEAQLIALKEDADITIEQSLASLAIAEDRYQQVRSLAGGAVAEKNLQDLKEIVDRSRAAVAQAREKLPFLPAEPYERPLQLGDVEIRATLSGRIVGAHVRRGQLVAQGDPLWTLADWSKLWLKVPVFEGDLARIEPTKAIEVTLPGGHGPLLARPTGIPLPTEPGRRSVDLLYEMDNEALLLRPGQAASVALPVGDWVERTVVPRSALLWDGLGSTWVYVRQGDDTFRRQRVEGRPIHADQVAIERGLDAPCEVVVVGAEALYAEEFKSQIQVEDDD